MFKTLSNIFSQISEVQAEPMATELALAVLLYEVASADMDIDLTEHSTIGKILAASFNLNETQVSQLLSQAQEEQQESISIQTFTSVLTKELNRSERIEFIQGLWQVAYADGSLDGHEEYIIRKISDLIYLNHSDYIKAKLAVLDAENNQ